ncbi:TraR/DksA family transcriptional regulator [Microbacterium aurum]
MSSQPTVATGLDTAHFQRLLERSLVERLEILRDLEPRAVPSVDPVAYQTAGTHRRVVEQITAALNRVDAGTYGTCIRCATPISPARLEAVPHAAACRECQNQAEMA